jgi:hypothetical protein
MKMAHTPGPWEVTKNAYGTVFVHGGETQRTPVGTPYKELIAGGDNYATLKFDNARLIASSPDLLEALKLAKDHSELEDGILDIVDAAIAKAEGEMK